MRALLAILLLAALAVGGWLAYQNFLAPVEKRACANVKSRCDLDQDTVDACEKVVREVAKASGDEAADRFAKCVADSRTCTEAAGCATGLGTSAFSKHALEFLNGLRRSQ
jgi:hypothetical protein